MIFRTTLWNNIKGRVKFLSDSGELNISDLDIGKKAEFAFAISEIVGELEERVEKLEKKIKKLKNG